MAAKRLTALVQRLREEIVEPFPTKLTQRQAEQSVESARQQYSRVRGPLTVKYFTSVVDQNRYAYDAVTPKVATILDVLQAAGIAYDWEAFNLANGIIFAPDVDIYSVPSIGFIRELRATARHRFFDIQWEDSGVALLVYPAPRRPDERIYYEYRAMLDFEDIPERSEDLLMEWAAACALEKVISPQALFGQVRSVSGGGQSTVFNGVSIVDVKSEIARKKSHFNLMASIQ